MDELIFGRMGSIVVDARYRMSIVIEECIRLAKYNGTREIIGRYEVYSLPQSNEDAIESHPIIIEVFNNVDHAVCFNGTSDDVQAYLERFLV